MIVIPVCFVQKGRLVVTWNQLPVQTREHPNRLMGGDIAVEQNTSPKSILKVSDVMLH
jgi:hypothetical protein